MHGFKGSALSVLGAKSRAIVSDVIFLFILDDSAIREIATFIVNYRVCCLLFCVWRPGPPVAIQWDCKPIKLSCLLLLFCMWRQPVAIQLRLPTDWMRCVFCCDCRCDSIAIHAHANRFWMVVFKSRHSPPSRNTAMLASLDRVTA